MKIDYHFHTSKEIGRGRKFGSSDRCPVFTILIILKQEKKRDLSVGTKLADALFRRPSTYLGYCLTLGSIRTLNLNNFKNKFTNPRLC